MWQLEIDCCMGQLEITAWGSEILLYGAARYCCVRQLDIAAWDRNAKLLCERRSAG